MVRTRAENTARKAVAAKAPRKNFTAAGPSSSATSPTGSKGNKNAGGNPYCPRPTPEWQKEITNFFIKKPKEQKAAGKENQDPEIEESGAASSSSKNDAEDVPTSSKTAEASNLNPEKEEEKVEEDKETEEGKEAEEDKEAEEEKDEEEMMEVEIEIKDKKMEEGGSNKRKRESPRPFQKNNCISDSDDSDDNQ